jgi:hypothetical protein
VQRKYDGLVLILLSIIQFLVGGGIISPIVGIAAGGAGTKIQAPFTWWLTHLVHWRHLLATLWPWSLLFFFFWLVGPCAGYVRRVTHDEIADAVG